MGVGQSSFIGPEDALTGRIIQVFQAVHRELGIGFLESVYAKATAIALEEKGFHVQSEVTIPVWFHGKPCGIFRADLIVNHKVILEFKVVEQLSAMHIAQLRNYLRATKFEIGLILAFGSEPLCRRVDFENKLKQGIGL